MLRFVGLGLRGAHLSKDGGDDLLVLQILLGLALCKNKSELVLDGLHATAATFPFFSLLIAQVPRALLPAFLLGLAFLCKAKLEFRACLKQTKSSQRLLGLTTANQYTCTEDTIKGQR